jgi:hypothetical protein
MCVLARLALMPIGNRAKYFNQFPRACPGAVSWCVAPVATQGSRFQIHTKAAFIQYQ